MAFSFATPISEHGKLSVSGRKILDKNGDEYVLRGMSMFWDKWNEGSKFYNQNVVNTLAGSGWNSNVVRMTASQGQGSLQNAKNFMDWTKAAGIYVIIDWHYHDLDQTGAQNFFSEVAKYAQQKSYSHVIYEIFNEPKGPSWAQIKTFAQNVISKIRDYDKDGIILVGTPNMSSAIGSAKSSPLSSAYSHNVMYVLHFYAAESGHSNYKYSVQAAWCDDFPVFISEWGTSRADGGAAAGNNAPIQQSMNDGWMSLIETMGLSWANWSITDKGESSAALRSGASTAGSWSSGNLTPSGQYVQKIIKGRNTGGTLGSVGLSTVSINCNDFKGPPPAQRDGIAIFDETANAANYIEVQGADSAQINSFWILKNNSNNFDVSYTLNGIPEPGTYLVFFRVGSANDGATVSWSGDGVQAGSTVLPKTSSINTWNNSEPALITITDAPGATLDFTFNTSGSASLAFVTFAVYTASKEDSVEYNISPILPNFKNRYGFDVVNRSLTLHESGNLELYSLQGKRVLFNIGESGQQLSLQNLPAGAYVAVLRGSRGGTFYKRIIYLK
jgi:endoglucanase